MSDWWWYALVIVVILAGALVVYARARRAGMPAGQGGDSSRDYREERETSRTSGMSDEDRKWEAASLERNRLAQDRDKTPPSAT